MEKRESCVLIKHYFLIGKNLKETEETFNKYPLNENGVSTVSHDYKFRVFGQVKT